MSKITNMVTKNATMTPPTAPPTTAPSGDDSSGVSGSVVGDIEEVGRGSKYNTCGKYFTRSFFAKYIVQVGLSTICYNRYAFYSMLNFFFCPLIFFLACLLFILAKSCKGVEIAVSCETCLGA